MLIDSPLPELQIGLRMIVPVVLGACRRIVLFLVRLAVQRAAAAAGHRCSGMIGEAGRALTSDRAGRRRPRACARRDLDRDRRRAGCRRATVSRDAVKGLLLTVSPDTQIPDVRREDVH